MCDRPPGLSPADARGAWVADPSEVSRSINDGVESAWILPKTVDSELIPKPYVGWVSKPPADWLGVPWAGPFADFSRIAPRPRVSLTYLGDAGHDIALRLQEKNRRQDRRRYQEQEILPPGIVFRSCERDMFHPFPAGDSLHEAEKPSSARSREAAALRAANHRRWR
jgi:hypothetical protein